MPNEQPQKPKPRPQRPLTPQELETASGFTKRWNQSQLALIWKRKMPADANLDDFQMFLYIAEQKDLDPLLSEVYCQLRYNKDTGEQQLTVIDGIHGMIKSADRTGELNGIETSYDADNSGNLVSATTTVHRKGCSFPFRATAYVSEYDAKTFIWNTKKRVMIAKCSLALALRLAFAAALAGVYIAEEFERDDNRPAEDEHFEIGVIEEPKRLDPDVAVEQVPPVTLGFFHPGAPGYQEPPAAAPPQEESHAPAPEPMPDIDYKSKNQAYKQRIMKDMGVSPLLQTGMLTLFFKGWLGVDVLPKDPAAFTPGWQALDGYQTTNKAASQEFINNAQELGAKLKKGIASGSQAN